MWLVYEAPHQAPEIVSTDSVLPILKELKQDADQRGLPVIFPVMDMAEINQVSVNDIVSMSIPHLSDAAKRYTSDAILVGHVVQDAEQNYVSQWKWVMGNEQTDWSFTGKTPQDILTAVTNKLANQLASHYAVVMSNQPKTKLTLVVQGITEENDLSQVINYIKHLTPVVDVQLVKVEGSRVVLMINLRSSKESFVQALSLGAKFTALPTEAQDTTLNYQWNH